MEGVHFEGWGSPAATGRYPQPYPKGSLAQITSCLGTWKPRVLSPIAQANEECRVHVYIRARVQTQTAAAGMEA